VAALLQQGGTHPFVDLLKKDGVSVVEISCGRRRYDREARALRQLTRAWRPDVLHTHVYHADFVGYFAARRCGVPIVAHMHGIPGGDLKDRTYQWLDLKLIRHFDAVIAVSEPLRQRVVSAGCDPARVHLVPNPYAESILLSRQEARAALGMTDGRPAVGWVGRMRAEKGVDLFLRAFALLPKPRPLAVMVGAGVDLPRARALASELRIDEDVYFAGEHPDAGALLRAFEQVVISSRNEGLPMLLLEAMSAGVAVVSFSVGGIPDILDGDTGWLVPAGDLSALAAAISEVIARPAEAQRRARAAETLVRERYSSQQWLKSVTEVHQRVALADATSVSVR
jgi:glycosyltransferase involved in cell wall biosynthesis